MARDLIIEADRVSKRYQLGGPSRRTYGSLRESLALAVRALLRPGSRPPPERSGDFLALDGVSFGVRRGEAVGIIGRNGAGKSTLLKILSRITAPTSGEIRLAGRVVSLLEVGTGFHPELTGRENIFLNGALLGMRRAEIGEKFDEIVAFAAVERFLDTPVKRYSSGMYMRLAFAVAAHLSPEVLIVDEVLAVGDAAFQKKCLGKMQDVARDGRAVLFVSHNLAAISRLCSRGLLLEGGRLVADGPIHEVVAAYAAGSEAASPAQVDYERLGRAPAGEGVELLRASVRSEGEARAVCDIRRPVEIVIEFEVGGEAAVVQPAVILIDEVGECVLLSSELRDPRAWRPRAPGRYRAAVTIPGNSLAEGLFSVTLALCTFEPFAYLVHEPGALTFSVHDPAEGDSVRGPYAGEWPGAMRPALPWSIEPLPLDRSAGLSLPVL